MQNQLAPTTYSIKFGNMKKLLNVLFLMPFLACSDGDLQVEALDFENSSISFCGSAVTEETSILFKISGREAIILELDGGLIQSVADTTITRSLGSGTRLVYRLFSEDVNSDYFCDAIPPADPLVLEEAEATEGLLTVNTTVNSEDTNSLDHELLLSDITLENERGERITDLRINDFGTVTTKLP